MTTRSSTPPWVWVAAGCGAAVVLLLVAGGAFLFFGARMARQLERDMEDPGARAEKAREVLGSEALPPGYYPVMALSVPLVMEMAILSDVEPPPGRHQDFRFDDRGFLYVEMLSTGGQRREVEDFFAGEIDQAEFLRRSSVSLHRGEVLQRGSVMVGELEIPYVAQRGSLSLGRGGDHRDSLTTTVLVECPGSSRLRLGMWFGNDPAPEVPGQELDLAGTTADPAALVDFLGHFRLCD